MGFDDELLDKEEIYSDAVGDKEVVSPANINLDSDSSKGESDDDLNPQPTSSVQASSIVGQIHQCLLDRDGTARKCSNPVSSGRAGAYNVFIAKPEVSHDVASSRSP